jgi:acetyl-CoA acetyltransferase family protein
MRTLDDRDAPTPPSLVLASARTVFGRNRGGLSHIRTDDLAALPLVELVKRHPSAASRIDDVILGNTNGAGEDNRNVARMASLLAGLPTSTPAVTVNRLCGSGGESIVQAARALRAGDVDCVIAGGVEGMSRAPLVLPRAETRLQATQALEQTTVGWRLVNPRFPAHWTASLGACVEATARKFGISREEQDSWALRSHRRAAAAWDDGLMSDVTAVDGVTRDESIRPKSTTESLAALAPAFLDDGTLTAGNSSPINDGAAALLMANDRTARDLEIEPRGEIAASCTVAVEPDEFAIAPALAVRKLLDRRSLRVEDIAVWEVNEAFAAVVLAFLREFDQIDPESMNVHGGAIALGHPLGASMTRVVADTVARLRRRGGGLGIAAACIGVGQGSAVLVRCE